VRKTNWTMVVVAVLAAAFALTGCADQGDMQQLNKNEFTLRGMIAADRQQLDALKAQVARQNDQIEELQHGAGTAGGTASGVNDRVASLEAEVKALQAGMAAAPGAMPPPGAPADSVGPVASAPPPAGVTAPPATPAEIAPTWPAELDQEIAAAASSNEPGIKIYREGLDAMKAGKYPLAVTRFTKLQHAYPKSPLSEPAEYFAANALFETGGYDQAILQFNDLVMRFPKGKYASAALLREAQAFVKLNDRIDARLTLQKLVADHAGTPEAASADTMMKDLASD
jgi:tol-pal system protein YbgF